MLFELNYRLENVKEMKKCFYLNCLDSFLVFKKSIREFDWKFCVVL